MRGYEEEDFLMISGIQHFSFCRRQWALIHIEQQWAENIRTFEGELFHERAHNTQLSESRGGIIVSRGMPVFSRGMGVSGTCDIVEFHPSQDGIPLNGKKDLYTVFPIEYKKGKPKDYDADILQLTAQAMCLEEMLLCHIEQGALFYGENRRRMNVVFSETLREKVKKTFLEMHQYYERRYTPKVKWSKACNACSLKEICLPEIGRNKSVNKYIAGFIREDNV